MTAVIVLGVAGPVVPAVAACEWCCATVTYDPERDGWVDANGKSMCAPEARGATCAWASYRAVGIEPTTLRNHDLACTCQFAFPHMGGKTPAYAGAVPACCGWPMRAMSSDWRCRRGCGRVVLPGEACEIYPAAPATAPGPVTPTDDGVRPRPEAHTTGVAGPGAVNTARSRIPSSTNHFPLRDEGGVNAAPPSKSGAVVEHDGMRPPAAPSRAAQGQLSEGGRAHGGRRPAHPRPSLHRRQPRV